jgi:signal transduction histidine kinase
LWQCAKHWLAHPAWRRGSINWILTGVFVLLMAINLTSLCNIFLPQIPIAFTDPWRALTWPILSASLLLTLLWRHQRAQSLKNQRRIANVHKLHEQISIRLALQQFLTMMVHEVKTPLTLVQLGTHALARDELAPERRKLWGTRMQVAVKSIVQILDNCGQAERFEAGAMPINPSAVDLRDLLTQIVSQAVAQDGASGERITLRIDAPEQELTLLSDPAYLRIILNNLVGNAVKYAAPGSAIVVELSRSANSGGAAGLKFSVSNQIGAAGSPDPARAFERYYRAPTASAASGTGLGLWLSQQLARRLGTAIALSVEDGRIVFGFTLQAYRETSAPTMARVH